MSNKAPTKNALALRSIVLSMQSYKTYSIRHEWVLITASRDSRERRLPNAGKKTNKDTKHPKLKRPEDDFIEMSMHK